jgi:hypothetical protein
LLPAPYFQIVWGTLTSLGASFAADWWFFGKVEKKRAAQETWRAYNKLMNRLVHTSITDIGHPLHLMPIDISDRIEDLRFTLRYVNPQFSLKALVEQAIQQSADLRKKQRKKQENLYGRQNSTSADKNA